MSIINISYTSISTFKQCRRRFKFKYIDKVYSNPISSPHLSYGCSIHNALSHFNKLPTEKQTETLLLDLLKRHWISKGYESSTVEQRFYKDAEKLLKNYFQERRDIGRIILNEDFLNHNINPNIVLTGKIDKLFINENNELELLDYKTGSAIVDENQLKNDLQIPIYFLLTKYKFNVFPKVISYYYLSPNVKISMHLTKEIMENGVINLKNAIREIVNEKVFECNPSNICSTSCEYYSQCDVFKNQSYIS